MHDGCFADDVFDLEIIAESKPSLLEFNTTKETLKFILAAYARAGEGDGRYANVLAEAIDCMPASAQELEDDLNDS